MALKEVDNIYNSYLDNNLSHAYLVETNNLTNAFLDVKILIKKILCNEKYNDNCEKCNLCHLIDDEILPNLVIVKPDGKSIKKDAIDNLKNKFSMIPIYSKMNVYIILEADKMNSVAFNKMLKFVEEPEDNILGFFITENKDNVASTIISRCTCVKFIYNLDELKSSEDNDDKNEYYLKYANELYNLLENDINSGLWYNTSVIARELTKREDVIYLFKLLLRLYQDDIENNVDALLAKKLHIIYKYLEQLNYNVNVSLLIDSFIIEMGDLYE